MVFEIIGWVVPFLLGLCASLIIDWFRSFKNEKRTKKFILTYLKDTILPSLIGLDEGFQKVKSKK